VGGRRTEATEARHFFIAWLVLTVSFSARYLFYSPSSFPPMLLVMGLAVGAGFVLHELAHKYAGMGYGCWAEFRMWPMGLAMALLFAFATGGQFVYAAPGATYIYPRMAWALTPRVNAIISLAGPATNVVLAVAFLPLTLFGGLAGVVGEKGFVVNLWLAAFNLLPFGGLDGQKVMAYNARLWALTALPIWAFLALQTFQLL